MIATYHGVVRGGVVLLDNGTPLADGTEVHVTPVAKPVANGPAILAANPPLPRPKATLGELIASLQENPILGDDAESFAEDLRAIRAQFPAETNPWE